MGGSRQQRTNDLVTNEVRKKRIRVEGERWEREYGKQISSQAHATAITYDVALVSTTLFVSLPGVVRDPNINNVEHISLLVETIGKLTSETINTTPLTQLVEAYNHPDTFDYNGTKLTCASITTTLCTISDMVPLAFETISERKLDEAHWHPTTTSIADELITDFQNNGGVEKAAALASGVPLEDIMRLE